MALPAGEISFGWDVARKDFRYTPRPAQPGREGSILGLPRRVAFFGSGVEANIMANEVEKKIAIKRTLSEKYERLSYLASSKVKQSTYRWHARHFRNQANAMQSALDFKNKSKLAAAQ